MLTNDLKRPAFKTDFSCQRPSVSVVIPLFNHEKYIEATINSVLFQTIAPIEIIVINDGSSDRSLEIVQRLSKVHPEIILWSWSNQGAHHALNAGILRATGDFVAILNSDDLYEPDRLSSCLDVIHSDPSVEVIATGVSFLDGQGQYILNPWYDNALAFFKLNGDLALSLFHANFLVTTSNLFIKRTLFDSIGLFSPLRYTHDLEFFLRLIFSKKKLHFVDRPLIVYRLHEKNTISENKNKSDIERAAVFAFFLFRKWYENEQNGSLQSQIKNYIDLLEYQEIIEIVEIFINLLEKNIAVQGMPLIISRSTDFLSFLSLVGIDWVTPGVRNPLLRRVTAARKSYNRRRKIEEIHSRQIKKLNLDRKWLLNQCNAWEKATKVEESQAQSLIQALRDENVLLQEQCSVLEKVAKSQERETQTLIQGLRADNTWLLEQRNAWEHAAGALENNLARLQSELTSLTRNRFFQFLIRVNLIKLTPIADNASNKDTNP